MSTVLMDAECFEQIKEPSRKAYVRVWGQLKDFNSEFDFSEGPHGEDLLMNYFKDLRLEKKVASSTMWTFYSYINSIMQRKYGVKLQAHPRITLLIKGFIQDEKNKAQFFDEVLLKQFMVEKMVTAYWEVRQAITIVAYFGGLHLKECLELQLERISRGPEGFSITHSRMKQRSEVL